MKKGLIVLTYLPLILLSSCSSNEISTKTYDGREFDISLAGDKSLLAVSKKEGNYYSLEIKGTGQAFSYQKKEEVPWYPIAKKIDKVTIENGIENIGSYYFSSLSLSYYILPSSVKKVESNSFNKSTIIYTYGSELDVENEVYYYSETKPNEERKYFYLDKDNIPHVWYTASVLFIGNSFTYYVGSEEDPRVPKYFKSIANNLNQMVDIDYVVKGSHTLAKFSSSSDPYGKIVEEKLQANRYDYVILQEQSTTPINNYQTFLNSTAALKEKIDRYQDKCQTVLYETWGSPTGIENTKYKTVGEMELDLRTAYKNAGEELGIQVNYVGKAFTYVYENTDINIYFDDNRHQNNYGAYLSALVHVRSLFNFNLEHVNEYVGLNESDCKALISVANNN